MPSYLYIVLFRIIEIISRFFFLGLCLRNLSLENYGKLSYFTALLQFVATILFSGTLQSLSQLKDEDDNKKKYFLYSLSLISVLVFIIFFATLKNVAYIFIFYSILYISTGWSATTGNQLRFSAIRSFSFLIQASSIYISKDSNIIEKCYQSYGFASLALLTCFPWRSLKMGVPSLNEWSHFFKFQGHNLTFQFTKIVERWVMLFLLNEKSFGLYSTYRDLINAFNLALFSPLYQIYYKKLVMGFDYKKMYRKFIKYIIILMIIGEIICLIFPFPITKSLVLLKLEHLSITDLALLILLCGLDFSRSLLMMIAESKNQFKRLFTSHFFDIAILVFFLGLNFFSFPYFTIICLVLIVRLGFLNLYFGWKET